MLFFGLSRAKYYIFNNFYLKKSISTVAVSSKTDTLNNNINSGEVELKGSPKTQEEL